MHNKEYFSPEEEEHRKRVFLTNLRRVDSSGLNARLYSHADLSDEEFLSKYSGLISKPEYNPSIYRTEPKMLAQTASSVNWMDKNKLGSVRNQGSCGSCYAFATVQMFESYVAERFGKPVQELSEQHIVDCTKSYGNIGCSGGYSDISSQFLLDVGALKRQDYPYTAEHDAACRHNPDLTIRFNHTFGVIPNGRGDLMASRLQTSPLSASLDALVLRFYKSGIISSGYYQCSTSANHAVLIIGYENLGAGKSYWRIRNSWGEDWGESGNFRLQADMSGDGMCGINNGVIYLTGP